MSPDDTVIALEDVSYAYGALSALQGVSLSVRRGEFLGIIGPNAGGKSTLLKLILGLLKPQRGSVRVLGQAPGKAVRHLGYVPQHPGFARDFPVSVEQVVLMGCLQDGWPGRWRAADHQAARQALAQVEAEDLAHRQVGALSGGQMQRVLLARALVGHPEVLILDEPTASIDQRMEVEIFDLLRRLARSHTILVVSHDVAFISAYVTRVACVNRTLLCHGTDAIDGRVIQDLYGESVRMVAHRHG